MKRTVYSHNVFSWDTLLLESCVPHLYEGPVMQMAAPADYLDAADLLAVTTGGLIREDVLDEIFDCSEIPTPFLDSISSDTHDNPYCEWTEDELNAPDITNAVVSGSDASGNDADTGQRRGNHSQICDKVIAVTTRVQHTDNIGRSDDEMGYQTARRMQEVRRDIEAIALTGQASVADNNNATAGKSAGFSAWLTSNDLNGTGGAAPGFQTGTGLVTVVTRGQRRALTWEMVRDVIELVYTKGADVQVAMSVPGVIKRLAVYLFTTPFAAVPTANVNGTGGGADQTSQGYIDVFRTDFGTTVRLVANRLQQTYLSTDSVPATAADLFLYDPRFVRMSYLYEGLLEVLAKLGLSDRKQASTDWSLKVLLERAHGVVRDINPTAAVTTP